jgi:MOSC domain-containing protein
VSSADRPRVASLHRYPVKSMLGERLRFLDIDERGCLGDRRWSVRTATDKIGSGKSTRRFAAVDGLLQIRAEQRDGTVLLRFPDGGACTVDSEEAAARVSRLVGQPVTLARETTVSHFDDGPVSLLGHASVAAVGEARDEPVDVARFRANILVDGLPAFAEDAWIGRRLAIGTAVLRVDAVSPRCVMVNAGTADLPAQPGNLAAIGRLTDGRLGVVAAVVRPGRISVGDTVEVG